MPAEVEPAELAQLIDFAERPHTENWSLRAALVRYTSPQPQRNDLLELVRRIQGGLDAQVDDPPARAQYIENFIGSFLHAGFAQHDCARRCALSSCTLRVVSAVAAAVSLARRGRRS